MYKAIRKPVAMEVLDETGEARDASLIFNGQHDVPCHVVICFDPECDQYHYYIGVTKEQIKLYMKTTSDDEDYRYTMFHSDGGTHWLDHIVDCFINDCEVDHYDLVHGHSIYK